MRENGSLQFLIDNNLAPRVAQALRELGFSVAHVREYGMQQASDAEIFERALREERVIVSADTDFGFILARWNQEKPSVILFRHFSPHAEHQVNALEWIAEKFKLELETGSIIVIEPKGVRIRKLPLF